MTTLTNVAILTVESPSFTNEGDIPSKYTCEGNNVNPPLKIKNLPADTKSLAIVVDDVDVPSLFTHWVVWNIKPTETIPENTIPGMEGRSSFGTTHYRGPCPPVGTHRYYFKVYALNSMLNLPANANKADVERAIKHHILGKGELIGLYKKNRSKF